MDKVIELLKRNNINYIVSVDDCYMLDTMTAETKFVLLNDITANTERYREILDLDGLPFIINLPEHVRKKEIDSYLDRIDNVKFNTLFQIYDRNASEGDEFKGLVSQRDTLKTFFSTLKSSDTIKDYKTYGKIEDATIFLHNEIDTLWSPSDESRVLWLIDRDFSSAGGGRDDGLRFLEQFINKKWNISILASQNTTDISTGNELYEYLKNLNSTWLENINLAWLVDKDYLSSDKSEELAMEIEHGLRRNYSYWITDFLVENFNGGLLDAKKKFKSIEQPTINKIVLNFSNKEGVSLVETLLRVLFIYTKDDLNRVLRDKLREINKLIREYENLCQGINEDEIKDDDKVVGIRRKEKYNEWVNELYYPIGFGDIFKINNEMYLLVSQPCDIALRGEQDRKVSNALLLKISNQKPASGSGDDKHKTFAELKYFKQGEPHYVLYKEILQVDFNILDLCSINSNGKAEVDVKVLQQGIDENQNFSKMLIKKLNKVLGEINAQYLLWKHNNEKLQRLEDYIVHKCKSKEKETLVSYIEDYKRFSNEYWQGVISIQNFYTENNVIGYNVRRICRLDELMTISICADLNSHNARIGVQGDFAEGYEPTIYTVKMENPLFLFDMSTDATIIVNPEFVSHKKNAIENIISEFILPKIETAVTGVACINIDRGRIISKNDNDKNISINELPANIKGTKHYCWVSSKAIKFPIGYFIENCPSLVEYISAKLLNNEIIGSNNLYKFRNDKEKRLNQLIAFKKDELVHDGDKHLITIKINNVVVTTIEMSINDMGNCTYELDVNIVENKNEIDTIKSAE